MPRHDRRTRRAARTPGVTTWQTRQELERTRRRQLIPVVVLAVLAVLWCLVWLTVETHGENAMVGWVVMELITLVPLVFGARRVVRVSSLMARVDAYSDEDQVAEAESLRTTDESIWRVAQLVSSLEDGPAREAARGALAAAERAAALLRPLIRRRTQLEHLVEASRSRPASAALQATLTACREDIDRLQATIEDVGASVASLVDAATDAVFERELAHVRQATDDVQALVTALREIEEIGSTTGRTAG